MKNSQNDSVSSFTRNIFVYSNIFLGFLLNSHFAFGRLALLCVRQAVTVGLFIFILLTYKTKLNSSKLKSVACSFFGLLSLDKQWNNNNKFILQSLQENSRKDYFLFILCCCAPRASYILPPQILKCLLHRSNSTFYSSSPSMFCCVLKTPTKYETIFITRARVRWIVLEGLLCRARLPDGNATAQTN